jgi:hypothetical protein
MTSLATPGAHRVLICGHRGLETRTKQGVEKEKNGRTGAANAAFPPPSNAVGAATRHLKIVGRRQTCDVTRHASDLAKLRSEVKYAPTHKRDF